MGSEQPMKKADTSITFKCPGCSETFEFDRVGEYQLVPCPICGIDFITILRNQTLLLESFEFNTNETFLMDESSEVTSVES
jgi:Zn finger protein HypA/HybF involved in hydrogenase expression